jgi:hypothetical protein
MRLPQAGQLLPSVSGKIASGTTINNGASAVIAITYPGVKEGDQAVITGAGSNWDAFIPVAIINNAVPNTVFIRVWNLSGGNVTLAADLVAYAMVLPARK